MDTWVLAALWESETEAEEHMLAALLPPQRLARMTHGSGRKTIQILAAYALLHYGARRFWGFASLPEMAYGATGKPVFLNDPAHHFNLSHTDGLALCAFSDAPVGVDGERLRLVDPALAERLRIEGKDAAFFEEWTARESCVKRHGGSAAACRAPVLPERGEQILRLRTTPAFAAAVCARSDAPVHLEQMDFQTLLQRLTPPVKLPPSCAGTIR